MGSAPRTFEALLLWDSEMFRLEESESKHFLTESNVGWVGAVGVGVLGGWV